MEELLNQFKGLHDINLSKTADFVIDKTYTFEFEGKHKTRKQIAGIGNAYVREKGC